MQRQVAILPDGQISFPLAGDLNASGLTVAQLKAALRQRLKAFFADPVITVSVVQVSGNKIYVIGQVGVAGEFIVNRPMDVMQALSIAGGLGKFASKSNIKILRRTAGGKQRALSFDYSAVSKGDNLESNILLQSGDIVVVPEGIF